MPEQYSTSDEILAHQRSLWRKIRRSRGDGCADAFVAGMGAFRAEGRRAGARWLAATAPVEGVELQAAARAARCAAFRDDTLAVLRLAGSVAEVKRRLGVTEEALRAYVSGAAVPSAAQAAEVRALVERLEA